MKNLFITTLLLAPTAAFAAGSGSPIDGLFTADMAYKAINFLILLVLLHIFVKKPLTSALRASAIATRDEFELTQKQVEEKEEELKTLKADFEKMTAELEAKKATALKAMAEDKVKMIADTKEQAKLIEEGAIKRANQATLKAKNDIRNALIEQATKLAAAGLKDNIDKAQKKSLLDSYNNTLDEAG